MNDTSQERVDETSKNVHKPCGLECDCTDVCKQFAPRAWVEIDGDDWIKALEMADFDKVAAFEFFENKLKELNT